MTRRHPLPEAPTSASPHSQRWTTPSRYLQSPGTGARQARHTLDDEEEGDLTTAEALIMGLSVLAAITWLNRSRVVAVLYALNGVGLAAALWVNSWVAALLFTLGMAGSAVAMIGCAVMERGS